MTLFARSLSRFLTTPATEVTGQSEISSERAALIAAAREWGYFAGAIKNRRDLWHGRRMLDVGMGGGPHSLSFIEGGALSYVGVDPLIGTDHVRDFRNLKDSSIPAYHAFPFSAADIMRLNPNIHLYSGHLEDVTETVKAHRADIAIMDAVSEHLARPEQVIRAIWDLLDRDGLLWIGHCNYYSWTGHHRAPRSVAAWQTDDPEQARHVDWRHLDPAHPDYSNPNLNRVRLEDLRVLIAKYFEIIEWRVSVAALSRLTPDIRQRWRRYTLAELLGQNVYITGRRRDEPLDIDLSGREFFHPGETYLADREYSSQSLDAMRLVNSVYFSSVRELRAHSDNDHAGSRLMGALRPGDRVEVSKFIHRLAFTVDEVYRPGAGQPRLRLREAMSPEFIAGNHDQWTLTRMP